MTADGSEAMNRAGASFGTLPTASVGARIRILFVLEFYWPQVGGVETMFWRLVRELAAKGHECVVLTTRLPDTPAEETYEGVRIIRLGHPDRPSRYAFTVQAFSRCLELARDVDLIHTTTYNAAPVAWLVGTMLRKPKLLTVHEYLGAVWHALPDTAWPTATVLRLFERVCVALPFDAYVAVSRSTRNSLRQAGVPDRKLTTVYNGSSRERWAVDEALVRHLRVALNPEALPLVGYYGRAGITKGVEVLIDAFEILARHTPAKLLLLLGSHPARRRERLVESARRRLGEAVVVLPSVPRDELASYLALCDCIAVPSLSEGFGFTTFEASSLNKVVVASDVGSIPEVIFGRYLLVPPNDPAALAASLERALKEGAPPTPPREFTVDAMVEGYLSTYEHMLAATPPERRE